MSLDTDRLMNNARIHLPGATDAVLQLELFNVFLGFFQDTNIWKEDIDVVVPGTDPAGTIYYIEAESIASINRLMYVVDSNGKSVDATMATPGEIVFTTQPTTNQTYTVTVALTVNDPVARDGYPEIPAWVLNKYMDGLTSGLIFRMMAQPAKPYSNQQMGAYHYRKYAMTANIAMNEAQHMNVNSVQAWRFPQSFASVRRR